MTIGYIDYGFIVEGTHMEITEEMANTLILERLKEAAVGRNSEGEPVNANEIIVAFLKDLGHTEIADAFKVAVEPRPIESAPKDERNLIWSANDKEWSTGSWHTDDWRDDEGMWLPAATHWMPMLPPPVTAEENQDA